MRRNQVAVVGAAETTELGVIPNVSQIQLHADAALNAIAVEREWRAGLAERRPFDWRVWRWVNLVRWAEAIDAEFCSS